MARLYPALILSAALAACSDNNPPDMGPAGTPDMGVRDTGAPDMNLPPPPPLDVGIVVIHDAGGPITCNSTCNCPQGMGCISGECRSTGSPVWCCDAPGCPAGEVCLDTNDQPDRCDAPPPDAGVVDMGMIDMGPQPVGGFCEDDNGCDQTQGLSCWTRDEPPFVWGYCTLENCDLQPCPGGSECLTFNTTPPVTGCLQSCSVDANCRADAFCLPVAGTALGGVCIPDCRDDLFDCSPRDGTQYCDPATGQCGATPSQDPQGEVGDPCVNSTDCGAGQICMSEFAWGFPGGMCTRVCNGLPEATACDAGETCQNLAGIGLCFKDCLGNACPDRNNAICGTLDPSWTVPGCVPQ